MAYRKVRELAPAAAAYIAGLVDGEGTITLTRKHAGDSRQLSLTISSTEPPLLRRVLRTVGAGKMTNKRPYQANHSPSVTYAINNRQALALIGQIAPYLHSYKARRAALVLRDYVRLTPRNGKYTTTLARRRDAFVNKFLEIRPRAHGAPNRRIHP